MVNDVDLVITRDHSNLLKRPPVVFISGVSDVKSSSSLDHFAVTYFGCFWLFGCI